MKKGNRLLVGYIAIALLVACAILFYIFYIQNKNLAELASGTNEETHQIIGNVSAEILEFPTGPVTPAPTFLYIEIVNGCGPRWIGDCTPVYSDASIESPMLTYIRNGVTLKVSKKITDEAGGVWYKIIFDEWLRYPERASSDWYVQGKYASEFSDLGWLELSKNIPPTSKRILIDKSDQKLYAYDGDTLILETMVSTGLTDTPTDDGTFKIFRKTPTRYMQGPLPDISEDIYDLPGVPWSLYFTKDGAAIHGTYWHTNFGRKSSHGCVNMPLAEARKLYVWADLATSVTVQE